MPKRRVNTITAVILYAFAGLVDLIDLILDFIPVIGWIIVLIIDLIMALILSVIFLALGIFKTRAVIAMFTSLIWAEVPIIGGVSAWILDVWYTLRRAKVEDAERLTTWQAQQANNEQAEEAEFEAEQENVASMQNEIRRRQIASEAVELDQAA